MSQDAAQVWHIGFYFDKRAFSREEASYSLGVTAFVCVILCLFSIMFSADADKLVLNPVEQMIACVEKIRDNPLMAMKMSDEEFRQEEVTKAKERIQSANKYDIAELFSPPRMTEMTEAFGLKGGWPIDDKCTDPVTGRTYYLQNKKTE